LRHDSRQTIDVLHPGWHQRICLRDTFLGVRTIARGTVRSWKANSD
jgi:hypothetical protein